MVDTLSRAAPGLNIIGALCSQNTPNTSLIKECEKDGSEEPFNDE